MRYAIILLSLAVILPAVAQERAAAGALDTQMTWSALSSQIQSVGTKVTAVNTRVDQSVACGAQGKVYAPGASGADSSGCKAVTPVLPACAAGQVLTSNGAGFSCTSNVNIAKPACPAGQVLTANGSSFACITVNTAKPVLRNAIATGSATAFRWPTASATCPAGTVVMGGGGYCSSSIGWVFLNRSVPQGNGWSASCDTEKKVDVTASVWAMCAYLQ